MISASRIIFLVLVLYGCASQNPSTQEAMKDGWVLVDYTVKIDGQATDIRVLDSYPDNRFDQAAVKAVEKFKFKPLVKNGVVVEAHNVEQSISFQFEE